jgi:outer membrane protein OmpA-like peptidoglycan-associated protein
VSGEAIEAQGMGEVAPLADNTTSAGRERNRRVELLLGR